MIYICETTVKWQESDFFLKNNSTYGIIRKMIPWRHFLKEEKQNPCLSFPKGRDPFVNAVIQIAFQTDFKFLQPWPIGIHLIIFQPIWTFTYVESKRLKYTTTYTEISEAWAWWTVRLIHSISIWKKVTNNWLAWIQSHSGVQKAGKCPHKNRSCINQLNLIIYEGDDGTKLPVIGLQLFSWSSIKLIHLKVCHCPVLHAWCWLNYLTLRESWNSKLFCLYCQLLVKENSI